MTSRTQTVTEIGAKEAAGIMEDLLQAIADKLGVANDSDEILLAVEALVEGRAHAVAQAREEGEREGIMKAAFKAANCKIEGDSWPYRSGQGFARKRIVKAIRAIPTPNQEDRTSG